jgi:transcriptional regulator GlxA family with amidase domain
MKNILLQSFIILFSLTILAQEKAKEPIKPLNVAVFAYPEIGLGDLSGPISVFVLANRLTKGQYNVYTFALESGLVKTQGNGLTLTPDYLEKEMPMPDILIIPGASMQISDAMSKDNKIIGFLQKYQNKVPVIMSVCTASYLLAKAGLLDNLKATTHHNAADDFQEQFPKIEVIKNVRYVDQGSIVTTSGITTGIDGAIHLVNKYSGYSIAEIITRVMQYTTRQDETWPVTPNGMKFDRKRRVKEGSLKE